MMFHFMEHEHSLNGAPNFRITIFPTYSLVLHLIKRGFLCSQAQNRSLVVWFKQDSS